MIELTPLEIRQKKNDFRRVMRGYDPASVDDFLEIIASHLDVVVREKMRLEDEVEKASQQVVEYRERERALTEALVTAQEMREVVRSQSEKEAALILREAQAEAERIREDAQRRVQAEETAYEQLLGRRLELIRTYRRFLEREMNELSVLEQTLELDGRMLPTDPAPEPAKGLEPLPLPSLAPEPEAAAALTDLPELPDSFAPEPEAAAALTNLPELPNSFASEPEPESAESREELPERADASPAEVGAAGVDLDAALSAAFDGMSSTADPAAESEPPAGDFELLADGGEEPDSESDAIPAADPESMPEVGVARDKGERAKPGSPKTPDWLESLLQEDG